MKSITEYSFRDIVGKFVKAHFPKGIRYFSMIHSEGERPKLADFDEYIAYVYIDTSAGMTFEIIGGYSEGRIFKDPTSSNKVRYGDDIMLEIFDDPDEEMNDTAKFIEENYTPDWILPMRENTIYDPYRDKAFPDDLLIPIHSISEEDGMQFDVSELLWVRPNCLYEGNLIGETIESGKNFERGTQVLIVRITDGNYKISAMTFEMIKIINESDNPAGYFKMV